MALSLYTKEFDGSAKAVVAAKLGGVELNVLPINKYTGKADAAKSPVLVVPGVSTDATGLDALKSVAGMGDAGVYNRPLAGFVPGEVTLVDKWVAFDAAELAPPVNLVAAMLTSKSPFDRRAYDAAMADVDAALKTLNDHLAGATFIANDELTLADVCVACTLYPAMARLLDAQARGKYPHVCRLFHTVAAVPAVTGVMGKPVTADKVKLPNAAGGGGGGGGGGEGGGGGKKSKGGSRSAPAPAAATGTPTGTPEEIAAAEAAAAAQGLKVKALKDGKKAGDASCTDDAVKAAVAVLLELKKKADALKGVGAAAPATPPPGGKGGKGAKDGGGGKGNKDGQQKETGLGLAVTREEDFGAWYSQVVVAGELIEYYDISGCYILRPWAYSMWESIKDFFDKEIKKEGVENCYFPLFVSAARLEAEKDHIEDFAPEVAWVTRSGNTELEVPIAVRPTSETVMYPVFANWIRSHRDLPLKLNQWCNVVRWEFKHPTPFIRSREFLWQEGHTAFTNKAEADKEVRHILELYRRVYEELLAVPVIPGVKSEKEKFAGGLYTTTVEAFVPATGRGIQGATSHCLGQNFAKMFHIEFENQKGGRSMVWQNSWGCTTRTIGVAVMVHGDDAGLVLPPRVAPLQVVVVTIPNTKLSKEDSERLRSTAKAMTEDMAAAGLRTKLDDRDNYTPGWKYNHWELKGVPLRCEFGPRDMEAGHCVVVRRDTRDKETVKLADLPRRAAEICEEMQADMLARATEKRNASVATCMSFESGFVEALDDKKMVLTPWCETKESEELVKKLTNEASDGGAAKTLCIPFVQPPLPKDTKCFVTGAPATIWVLWGRSY